MKARLLWSIALFTHLSSLCADAADNGKVTPTGSLLPDGVYRLQKAQILDQQGFGRPMTAVTMLVPAGWTSSGGVVWQPNRGAPCGKNGTRFEWRATSADGLSAIEILPEESWSGNNLNMPNIQQACPNVTITTVKDYLRWLAERVRPGARILDYRDRPDMTKSLEHFNRSEPSVGGELKSWIQGGEVLLGYQLNGHDLREAVAIVVMFNLSRMSGVMPGEIREFLTISAMPALAVRAPHGQLDFRLAEAVRLSMKRDPQWGALMDEHTAKMSGISAKGAADRHAIRMQTSREIAEINRQGEASRQASNDRSHEQFTQTIRGVETYVDTSSRERIELPNTHNHAWRLNDDTYILTDDPNFQPNRDLGIEGHQLKAER
jgi:hypothetical protein